MPNILYNWDLQFLAPGPPRSSVGDAGGERGEIDLRADVGGSLRPGWNIILGRTEKIELGQVKNYQDR
jgi:hypothetical protein